MNVDLFSMDKTRQKEILILLLCLIVGFALRFYTFDKKSLWIDEIHTFNYSRDDLKGQIKFYKENPTYLHPPLFFVLTHMFYPFTKPERDLRIIPLIFGALSIPMIYLLAKQFSASIALPSTLSLTFMAYHISLSQDGRSYSLLMFLGMAGIYSFMRHLRTSRKRYLLLVALSSSALFYTSYSSIPFIALSQILWFYQRRGCVAMALRGSKTTEAISECIENKEIATLSLVARNDHGESPGEDKSPTFSSFFILNGLILVFCLPWILFAASNYKGQSFMDPLETADPGSLWNILYGVIHDWVPHAPLMIISVILLILFPFFSRNKKNAGVLSVVFIIPIGGLYLYCKLLGVNHFVSSRYFISFLPLFFISVYLSLNAIEFKFERLRKYARLKLLFVILFIASNLVILPLYYRSEKQDLRGLVTYLKTQLRGNDKIFDGELGYMLGILHYFGAYPEGHHQVIPFWNYSDGTIEYRKSFTYQNKIFTIYHYKTCCAQYVADGSRIWIVVGKRLAKEIKKGSPAVLKGYFDGSFLNMAKFPTDAPIYLFLWDPRSPDEKGIDMPIE